MEEKGLRCVSYSRVSTEEEAQLNAIENQIEENRSVIASKGWILIDEYIDRGKSGTQVKRRDEYQRLFDDMLTDKFDIICIKDQDRLMRNTKDWYLFVDQLVQTGKRLFIYLENKFYTPDDALITGIKAIIAEEFSRNLSKKLHNFNDRRLEKIRKGDMNVPLQGSGNAYGWDKKDGRYTINPEQFKVRRLMCELVMQEKGSTEIAKILNDMGYRNSVGNPWKPMDIPKFVYDTKNVGTLILNKERKDFATKKVIKNPPSEWVYAENALPPIVTKEEWELICKLREKRSTLKNGAKKGKKVGGYSFSGKIVCGVCGAPYWRKQRTTKEEYWTCSTKQTKGRMTRKKNTVGGKAGEYNPEGCDNPNISYNNLMEILSLLSEQLSANTEQIKADMIDWLTSLRKSIIEANTLFTEADLNKELQRKDRLLDSLLDGVISKADYSLKIESIESKINSIREDIKKQEHKLADIGEIDRSLENIDEEVAKYLDDNNKLKLEFILQNLERIEVYPDKVIVKIPVFGREVIINNIQFVSGQKPNEIQTEKIRKVFEYTHRQKKLNVYLCMVA